MPRGMKEREPEQPNRGGDSEGADAQGAAQPGFQSWFEEAWHGWMKPVGGIVLVVVAYFLYDYRLVPESFGGRVLVALILGAAMWASLEPVFQRMAGKHRALIGALTAAWALSALVPLTRVVFWPAQSLGEVRLVSGDKGGTVTQELKLPDGETGPYEITVSGNLRGSGEAEANYALDVRGDGDGSQHVEGSIKRTFFRQRVSRRSAGTMSVREEHGEQLHRLGSAVRGSKLSISADIGSADALEDGLVVSVSRAWFPPYYFWVLGFAVFIVGLLVDYRMIAPKVERTYVAAAAAFTLVFTIYYPTEATPHNLVRPAVAALVLALLVGFLPGWIVSMIVNSYKPRPKKLAGVKG